VGHSPIRQGQHLREVGSREQVMKGVEEGARKIMG